ncbi:MAG: hypothetical protein RL095_2431 [Verrucomicrobiota bacterium]|jgi:prepilin-type N-terminal cleavage/methylation domain-containing protein
MRCLKFTLIELLAVVAVIAILLSLLLPAIAQSRYRAQASVCIANMKQFGVANGSYMADWGGKIPRAQPLSASGTWLAGSAASPSIKYSVQVTYQQGYGAAECGDGYMGIGSLYNGKYLQGDPTKLFRCPMTSKTISMSGATPTSSTYKWQNYFRVQPAGETRTYAWVTGSDNGATPICSDEFTFYNYSSTQEPINHQALPSYSVLYLDGAALSYKDPSLSLPANFPATSDLNSCNKHVQFGWDGLFRRTP